MTSNKKGRDHNKKICINCLGRNYLIECSCGCNNIVFMIGNDGINGKIKKRSRYNYEQYHKCCLLWYAVIHHIDKNKLNDDPSNLKAYASNGKHRHENHS